MGSDSDLATMRAAAEVLDDFGVPCCVTVVSAHRTPQRMMDFAQGAHIKGAKVRLWIKHLSAGRSAHALNHTTFLHMVASAQDPHVLDAKLRMGCGNLPVVWITLQQRVLLMEGAQIHVIKRLELALLERVHKADIHLGENLADAKLVHGTLLSNARPLIVLEGGCVRGVALYPEWGPSTMSFGSTAKVLLKCKLKYYRISECPLAPCPPELACLGSPGMLDSHSGKASVALARSSNLAVP